MTTEKIALPLIPAKRYFAIGEVAQLCVVKPHVLRYWEQEFSQLKPMKRRGNRRYYQHHEVLMIRRIRELLYEHGFTISGARNHLSAGALTVPSAAVDTAFSEPSNVPLAVAINQQSPDWVRQELLAIQSILQAKL